MSLEFENQQGEITTKPLFFSTEIKVVRFTLGAITVEISTNDNPNGSKTLDVNLRQNLDSISTPPDCTVNQTNVENTTNQSVLDRSSQPNREEIVEITEGPELQTGRDAVVQIMDESGGTNENGNPVESEESETKEKSEEEKKEEEYIKSMHGWLLTVAALFMSLSFTAELNLAAKKFENEQFMMDKYSTFRVWSSGAFYISAGAIMQLLGSPSFASVHRLISIRYLLIYAICAILVMHMKLLYSPFYTSFPVILLSCVVVVRTYRLYKFPQNRL